MGITGKIYRSMALSGAALLNDKKEEANNLNVFPVPDGDTGINMSLTMSTVGKAEEDLPVGECAEKVAALMLRSARGNSGAILSLYFRGIGKRDKRYALCGKERSLRKQRKDTLRGKMQGSAYAGRCFRACEDGKRA